MSLAKNAKVAVIGSGVSGLSFAYFLSRLRPDLSITIFEKQSRTGGWINSKSVAINDEHVTLEKGPRTLRGVSPGTVVIVDTLRQLGHASEVMVLPKSLPANNKYIWGSNKLVKTPLGLLQVPKFVKDANLWLWPMIRGFLRECKVPLTKDDESVDQFFSRRFGSLHLIDNVASAVFHGIYAGSTSTLSIMAILPKLKQLEQSYGSITKAVIASMFNKTKPDKTIDPLSSYSKLTDGDLVKLHQDLQKYPMVALEKGLETFPKALTEYLSNQSNVTIIKNANVQSVGLDGSVNNESFDHVRLTCDATTANALLDDSTLSQLFKKLGYVNVLLVNIYTRETNLIANPGFGFLVPRAAQPNREQLLGVIYDLDVEQHAIRLDGSVPTSRHGYSKITLMMGGHYFDKRQSPLDAEIRQLINGVLARYLNVDTGAHRVLYDNNAEAAVALGGGDLFVSYNYHHQCIPQYHVGYTEDKKKVLEYLDPTSVLIGGMAYGNGIGVPDCVMNSLQAATKLQ